MATEITLDQYLQTTYSIVSGTDHLHDDRYCLKIHGEFHDITQEQPSFAGKLVGYKIQTGLAAEDEKCLFFNVVDYTQEVLDIASIVYDIEKADWEESINQYFEEIAERDLLILSSIELLPNYRGKGFGPKLLKDFYYTHVSGCGLFVVNHTPIQFRGIYKEGAGPEWEYEKLDKNEERSTFRLAWKLNRLGFRMLPNQPDEYMGISTSLKNRQFDSIELG